MIDHDFSFLYLALAVYRMLNNHYQTDMGDPNAASSACSIS